MSKYLKVQVPDDFDYETSTIWIEDLGYKECKVWQPEYKNVLDFGFVGLIDFMGDDDAIVQAARVSYGRGTKRVSEDRKLLRHLMRETHTTPFEMVEFKFHVKAPIFVFRQWHRHRTFSINEYSGRYSEMTNEMYLPEPQHLTPQATDNKQGRSDEGLSTQNIDAVTLALQEQFVQAFDTYQYLLKPKAQHPELLKVRYLWLQEAAVQAVHKMRTEHPEITVDETTLNDKIKEYYEANEFAVTSDDFPGVARELARIVLPVATYSEMYWKGNLKNLLHFISLRSDPHAQYEIRAYSDAILEMIKPIVPWAVEAFMDYEMEGARLSRLELHVLQQYCALLDSDDREWIEEGLKEAQASPREIREFLAKLKIK